MVMGKSWEVSTLAAYSSGLLNFHVYCDQKGVPEDQHAPASPVLIHAFISVLAGTYSSSTINNYVYGIRVWHLIHGVKWQMEVAELEVLLRAAEKATPVSSRKKKRVPYTPRLHSSSEKAPSAGQAMRCCCLQLPHHHLLCHSLPGGVHCPQPQSL